jgi:hypothetical protein
MSVGDFHVVGVAVTKPKADAPRTIDGDRPTLPFQTGVSHVAKRCCGLTPQLTKREDFALTPTRRFAPTSPFQGEVEAPVARSSHMRLPCPFQGEEARRPCCTPWAYSRSSTRRRRGSPWRRWCTCLKCIAGRRPSCSSGGGREPASFRREHPLVRGEAAVSRAVIVAKSRRARSAQPCRASGTGRR